MPETEQNHERCRELRDILRQTQSRLSAVHGNEVAKRSELLGQREQLSEKYDRLETLKEAEFASGVGSLVSGPVGAVTGFTSAVSGVQITNLESQIRDLTAQIESLKHELTRLQLELDNLTQSQGEDGRELTALGCVSP